MCRYFSFWSVPREKTTGNCNPFEWCMLIMRTPPPSPSEGSADSFISPFCTFSAKRRNSKLVSYPSLTRSRDMSRSRSKILPFKTSALFGQINFGKTGVVIYFAIRRSTVWVAEYFLRRETSPRKSRAFYFPTRPKAAAPSTYCIFCFCAYFGSLVCRKTENRAPHGRQKRNVVKGIVDNFENRHHFRNLGNGKEILEWEYEQGIPCSDSLSAKGWPCP